ncbi:MAG: NAD(P)/FAD-dependent oxidoreductase [Bacteroidales bacterium]
MTNKKQAIIIGAGPAGLTAAYELLARTDIEPIVLESTGQTGGISQTVEYKGNRMDIGGHRFFSKSDRVMNWWLNILPIEALGQIMDDLTITYRNQTRNITEIKSGNGTVSDDNVMLVRNRLSRIFFGRKFYSYPIRLDWNTLKNLGIKKIIHIGWSYFISRLKPIKQENSLEDFFINRFGKELYRTFFKDYTEKVWGVPCNEIKPEWGAQRVKGLSVSKALWHALKSIFPKESGVGQKGTETSLIEKFLYPKFGPGQLWQEAAKRVVDMGGMIHHHCEVKRIESVEGRITGVWFKRGTSGEEEFLGADFVVSTMPVKDLIRGLGSCVPGRIAAVAEGLQYRDFITLGLLYLKMEVCRPDCQEHNRVPDNWIYIQEADVKVGRIQVFNNWSPYLVKDQDTVWLGLEYFCQEGDGLWISTDKNLIDKGIAELHKMGFCNPDDFLDGTVVRMPKTYPAYFGTYGHFDEIRRFTDSFANLFLIGRNGMHRYNNQDHSMLTAMTAVDLILEGNTDKDLIWTVNTEEEYHESSEK